MRGRAAGTLIAATLVVVLLAGCGGGSSGSSSSGDSTSKSDGTTASKGSKPPASEGSKSSASESPQGELSKEFVGKGANGKLAKVGKEATVAEREGASRVIEESFNARAEGDWKTQCSTLAAGLVEQIEKVSSLLGSVGGCAKALESQAAPTPPAVRANNMAGPVVALRVNQGINGFAFYHGTDGKDYVIPLIKQEGWKLVSLAAQQAP